MAGRNGHPETMAGLDIGTTKVAAVVALPGGDGRAEIAGVGSHPSHGLKRGVVVNIEKTVDSIEKAVEKAERMSGHRIEKVVVGIAGGHVKGMTGRGMVTLREKEVTPRDVERVIESANALVIPAEREIIHVIPQEYTVDRESGIKDPLGIHGAKLEADVHIVTGHVTAAQNLVKCVQLCGMTSVDMVLEQIASSEAILSEDEKEIGVAMIDCGGGTCDMAVFVGGSVRYTESLTLGGDHIDRDIAFGFSVPLPEARKLKEEHGTAIAEEVDHEEKVEVAGAPGRETRRVLKKDLATIIELRMEEMFLLMKRELAGAGFGDDALPAGVVLTGGASKMRRTAELAGRVFGTPVRGGTPSGVGGLADIVSDPVYSTGVGLAKYGMSRNGRGAGTETIRRKNVFGKMKEWFNEFF